MAGWLAHLGMFGEEQAWLPVDELQRHARSWDAIFGVFKDVLQEIYVPDRHQQLRRTGPYLHHWAVLLMEPRQKICTGVDSTPRLASSRILMARFKSGSMTKR